MTDNPFDLRAWLEKVDAAGQLKKLDGVNLKYELGAVTELNAKHGGPALLFDHFDGFDSGYRVLTGALNNGKTLGLAMGFEGPETDLEVVDAVADRLHMLETKADQFPIQYVQDGPVMENVVTDDIDLGTFPIPLFHEEDGGPFIGTGCWQIHQDPETGWTNVGTYRVQKLGPAVVGNYISPGHHGNIIRQKYWDKGEPCPVVMCFGAHPLFLLLGSSDVPAGVDELTWAGAVMGKSVPCIKGPVTGLPIPADAEIVIEGYAYPDDTMTEGPFGEFTGYYASGQKPEPVVRVKALYYRNQPILVGSPPGRVPNDTSYQFSVMRSAAIKQALARVGVPGVKGVWVSEAGGGRMFIVTSITQKYAGHAEQAAVVACSCQAGGLMARYSIVVDDDIDPSNNDDVIWALSTRSDPETDIDILRQAWSNPLDTMIRPEDKLRKRLWNSRATINACIPWDQVKWVAESTGSAPFPPVAESTQQLLNATKEKFPWLA